MIGVASRLHGRIAVFHMRLTPSGAFSWWVMNGSLSVADRVGHPAHEPDGLLGIAARADPARRRRRPGVPGHEERADEIEEERLEPRPAIGERDRAAASPTGASALEPRHGSHAADTTVLVSTIVLACGEYRDASDGPQRRLGRIAAVAS